jgi:general secretion pathway protein D
VLETVIGNAGMSLNTANGFYPKTAFLNADGVRAVISFLNTDAESEVVATPRAVMLDNQTATLSVTRAFPIFKVTPGSANTPAGSEIIYTNLGTILTVTPKIAANDKVSLKVVPEVSNIDSKDRQVINGQINEANVYAIRKIETQVTIPSGHTLVMGGLISDSASKAYTKVPLLGDLPGLGAAFRRETKTRNKVNLIIFITPTIVNDQNYHATPTEFLDKVPVDKPDVEDSFMDTGKPKQWRKKDAKSSK